MRAGPALLDKKAARGAAFGDLFNTGTQDVVVNNMHDPPSLLHNCAAPAGHGLLVELVGTRSNRSAIGARVTVSVSGRRLIDEVRSGGSFCSHNDLRIHMGLGEPDTRRHDRGGLAERRVRDDLRASTPISWWSFAKAAAWFDARRWCVARCPDVLPCRPRRTAVSCRRMHPVSPRTLDPSAALRRRDPLRMMAACMADWWLPRHLFAQRISAPEETRAPRDCRDVRRRRPLRGHAGSRGMGQHPAPGVGARAAGTRLSGRAPRRAHRTLQLDGRAGHRQPAERRRLRQRGAGHADHLRAVSQGTRAAARRSLGHRHEQELRADGRQQAASVWRSLLCQRGPAQAAADQDDQVGGEHEQRTGRRGSTRPGRAHDARARRGVRRLRVAGLRVGTRRSARS